MNLEIYKDAYGMEKQFLRAGKAKGRNILLREGFTIYSGPDFLRKGKIYANYSSNKGVWYFLEPIETEDGRLLFI